MTLPARVLKGGRDMGEDSLTPEAALLWAEVRAPEGCRPECTALGIQTPCLLGNGPVPSAAVIVGDAPTDEDDVLGTPGHGDDAKLLDMVLKDIDVDLAEVYQTFATKCPPPTGSASARKSFLAKGRKTCAGLLEMELKLVRPRAILAMGADAYYHFTHKQGITKNRGQAFWHAGYNCWVIPSMHPSDVRYLPQYLSSFEADVTRWWRLSKGDPVPPPVELVEVRTVDAFNEMLAFFAEEPDRMLTFDLETRGFHSQRDDYSFVWCGGITDGRNLGAGMRVYEIPFEHPDSPWASDKIEDNRAVRGYIIQRLGELLLSSRRVNGHNVKFDIRWLRRAQERYGLVEPHI